MEETIVDIQLADIILDESIYPRKNEAETRHTARRAFKNNSRLRSSDIGKAIEVGFLKR
ncbi:MAG: hypothetical protein HOJ48_03275 [Desulfobacula sp.]|jgi:hypothetical protein|nr:hypothetical protein [Desulfobacula sp.]MBT7261355.1 hypothetical protein [Desulfobacula sp.]